MVPIQSNLHRELAPVQLQIMASVLALLPQQFRSCFRPMGFNTGTTRNANTGRCCIWVRVMYNIFMALPRRSLQIDVLPRPSRSLQPCSDQHRPVATNEHRPCGRSSQQRRRALHPRHWPLSLYVHLINQ